MAGNGKVVFSIVCNGGTGDARVMKQARALRDTGFRVVLIANATEGFPETETVDGIEVRRFPVYDRHGIDLDDIAKVTTYSPGTAQQILEHARKVFTTGPELDRITQQKIAAKKDLQEASADLKSLAWVHQKKWWHVWKRVTAACKKEYKKAKYERNLLRDLISRLQAEEADLKRSFDLRHHMFFIRHALVAANLSKVKFEVRPDFIHCHDLYPLMAGVALADVTGAKVLFDAHEIETERVPPLDPVRKAFIDQMERDLFERTDHIVTCCASSSQFYHERFPKRVPSVVMNAPEIAAAAHGESFDVRQAAGLSQDDKVVIYTGGVGQAARGLDKVAEALTLLPAYHLVILGPRHAKNDAWLTDEARRLGVEARVHLLPAVPPEKVVAAVRSADVGVCPIQDVSLSYRYAMPNKLFEMTFAELPMVVSDLPEMRKFVEELGVGLSMDQTSGKSIADALKHAVDNRAKYVIGAEGRQILKEKYTWAVQAKSLISIYDEILEQAA